jgi:hypothetical protein
MSAARAASSHRRSADGDRLRLRANPLRLLFSAALWRAVGFLFSQLLVSGFLFAVALTASLVAAVLSITFIGAPLLIAAAAVVHGCAAAQRWLLRLISADPVPSGNGEQQQVTGFWPRARAAWGGRTWRETALLIGLWVPLYVLDTAVLAVWLVLLGGVALPAWYWTPSHSCVGYCVTNAAHGVEFGYFPHGPLGPGASGFYVDTLPKALAAAAGFLIVFLLFNYVVVLVARMHGRIVTAVLRPPADPLAEAKKVLAGPGPLSQASG